MFKITLYASLSEAVIFPAGVLTGERLFVLMVKFSYFSENTPAMFSISSIKVKTVLGPVASIFIVSMLLFSCGQPQLDSQEKAAADLASRVMGTQSRKIVFHTMPSSSDGKDVFRLESKGGKVHISGNSSNSMAVGLNHT